LVQVNAALAVLANQMVMMLSGLDQLVAALAVTEVYRLHKP
jgi:hypothetical protein